MADAPASSPSYLFINVCRIGDTVLATPAIRAVAEAYPRSEITCLGHPKRHIVMQHLPFIAHAGAVSKNTAWWRGWWPGKRWDYALVYGFDHALLRYALRVADRVVAFEQPDPRLTAQLYRSVERLPVDQTHAVDIALQLPALLSITPRSRRLAYSVSAEETEVARILLRTRIGTAHRPLIGLLTESFPTKAYRDWPLAHFIALAQRVKAQFPAAHFLVLGGKLATHSATQFNAALGGAVTIFAGDLSLRQSAAMIAQLDVYVGVDTGPTHIAGALDVPMVAMYHCLHSSARYRPLDRPNVYVIDHHATGTPACTTTSRMADVSVETVYARVLEALGHRFDH